MTTLGRWLADILNAHIERHNVPVAEPAPDSPLARFYIGQLDVEAAQLAEDARQHVPVGPPRPAVDGPVVELEWTPLVRPCWACGDPRGFHAFHLPCWKVAPWKPNADQAQRTYGAGGLL